jgi:hypothetical protein
LFPPPPTGSNIYFVGERKRVWTWLVIGLEKKKRKRQKEEEEDDDDEKVRIHNRKGRDLSSMIREL